jgi:hypothetical protein
LSVLVTATSVCASLLSSIDKKERLTTQCPGWQRPDSRATAHRSIVLAVKPPPAVSAVGRAKVALSREAGAAATSPE